MHDIYHGIGIRVNSICDEMLAGVSDEPAVRTGRCRPSTNVPGCPTCWQPSTPHFTAVLKKGQNSA